MLYPRMFITKYTHTKPLVEEKSFIEQTQSEIFKLKYICFVVCIIISKKILLTTRVQACVYRFFRSIRLRLSKVKHDKKHENIKSDFNGYKYDKYDEDFYDYLLMHAVIIK